MSWTKLTVSCECVCVHCFLFFKSDYSFSIRLFLDMNNELGLRWRGENEKKGNKHAWNCRWSTRLAKMGEFVGTDWWWSLFKEAADSRRAATAAHDFQNVHFAGWRNFRSYEKMYKNNFQLLVSSDWLLVSIHFITFPSRPFSMI